MNPTPDIKKAAGLRKTQLVLMPPVAEDLICQVLQSGADKYGINVEVSPIRFLTLIALAIELELCLENEQYHNATQKENTLVEECVLRVIAKAILQPNEPRAILIESLGEEGFVNAVMTEHSKSQILSIIKNKKPIVQLTTAITQKEKKLSEGSMVSKARLKSVTPKQIETGDSYQWESTHLLKRALSKNKGLVAQFVAKCLEKTGLSLNCNVTTTMTQECLEASCADVAIKDSVFWATLLRAFNAQFTTLASLLRAPITIESQKIKCYAYGAWNWRLSGVEAATYISAIKRHLAAIHSGEWLDSESGKPHIAHVAASACIMMDADNLGELKRIVVEPEILNPEL